MRGASLPIIPILAAFALGGASAFGQAANAETAGGQAAYGKTAFEYLAFLSEAERETLRTTGELTASSANADGLSIWKRAPFASSVAGLSPGLDETMAAEVLYLLDNPRVQDASERSLKILRGLTAFSTMKGIETYSVSRRRMVTFIYDSYRVASIEKPDRLEDPVFEAVPAEARFITYQKEDRIGETFSEFRFLAGAGRFQIIITNLTPVRLMLVPLVAPEGLVTTFIVVPASDKVILYGITEIKSARFLGIERLSMQSFYNRLKALALWFGKNLGS